MIAQASSIDLLKRDYDTFNRRDIDGALTTMTPGVEWPNGMEGGTVHGHVYALKDGLVSRMEIRE